MFFDDFLKIINKILIDNLSTIFNFMKTKDAMIYERM